MRRRQNCSGFGVIGSEWRSWDSLPRNSLYLGQIVHGYHVVGLCLSYNPIIAIGRHIKM